MKPKSLFGWKNVLFLKKREHEDYQFSIKMNVNAIKFCALWYFSLTLLRMGGGVQEAPYQFFPCNVYKRRI